LTFFFIFNDNTPSAFEIELDGKTYPLFDRTSNVDVDCVLPGRVDLVDSDLATLMEELKSHFGIDTDISLEFPSLNGIVFNNNMVWAQVCSSSAFYTQPIYSFYAF